MVKEWIRLYRLYRLRRSREKLIDFLWDCLIDEQFRCMRKHESYEDFKKEFHPIARKIHLDIKVYETQLQALK